MLNMKNTHPIEMASPRVEIIEVNQSNKWYNELKKEIYKFYIYSKTLYIFFKNNINLKKTYQRNGYMYYKI